MNEAILLTDIDKDGIGYLTLNRPERRNALSSALMTALQTQLDLWGSDPDVKVVILTGSGPAFSAGHDLQELRANPSEDFYRRLFQQCSQLMQTIVRLPKPVIAAVQGTATAAGCQLVASCDLAVAAKTAEFATPGVNIGLFCSTPMVALARNIGRKAAMEMLLTGEKIDAATAAKTGLINRVVDDLSLMQDVRLLGAKIAAKSPLTLKIGKEAFYRQIELPLDQAYDYAGEVMVRNMLARDAEEGIDAFLEKRQPDWKGC